jgi:hypothetical protein
MSNQYEIFGGDHGNYKITVEGNATPVAFVRRNHKGGGYTVSRADQSRSVPMSNMPTAANGQEQAAAIMVLLDAENKSYTLEFSLEDLKGLYDTSMPSFYAKQQSRFEVCSDLGSVEEMLKKDAGHFMYYLETAGDTLIAKKILQASGFKVLELWDLEAAHPESRRALVTDYASSWADLDPEHHKQIITVGCPIHGDFDVGALDHIGENHERIAHGCPVCGDTKQLDEEPAQ